MSISPSQCGRDGTRPWSAHGQHTVSARAAHGQHTVSTWSAHGQHTASTRGVGGTFAVWSGRKAVPVASLNPGRSQLVCKHRSVGGRGCERLQCFIRKYGSFVDACQLRRRCGKDKLDSGRGNPFVCVTIRVCSACSNHGGRAHERTRVRAPKRQTVDRKKKKRETERHTETGETERHTQRRRRARTHTYARDLRR